MARIKKNASFFGLLECHFSRKRKVAFLMKIKYEFVDGDVELEVSDEWASVLAELDRLERNNDKKEKRRHYSLEACTYEGEDFMADCDLLRDLLETEMNNELKNAINELQPQQKDLLFKVYVKREKLSDIAKLEGVSKMAITNRMKKIYSKLKKRLK